MKLTHRRLCCASRLPSKTNCVPIYVYGVGFPDVAVLTSSWLSRGWPPQFPLRLFSFQHTQESSVLRTSYYARKAARRHRRAYTMGDLERRKRKHKAGSPVADATRQWLVEVSGALRELGAEVSDGEVAALADKAPRRWVAYEPMVLLPCGSFQSAPWAAFVAALSCEQVDALWQRILAEVSRHVARRHTHLAVNEGIPLLQDGQSAANVLRSPQRPQDAARGLRPGVGRLRRRVLGVDEAKRHQPDVGAAVDHVQPRERQGEGEAARVPRRRRGCRRGARPQSVAAGATARHLGRRPVRRHRLLRLLVRAAGHAGAVLGAESVERRGAAARRPGERLVGQGGPGRGSAAADGPAGGGQRRADHSVPGRQPRGGGEDRGRPGARDRAARVARQLRLPAHQPAHLDVGVGHCRGRRRSRLAAPARERRRPRHRGPAGCRAGRRRPAEQGGRRRPARRHGRARRAGQDVCADVWHCVFDVYITCYVGANKRI